jgi:mycothiol synthase
MEGLALVVVTAPDASLMTEIVALLERSGRARDHAALSEHKWVELHHRSAEAATALPPGHHYVGVLARLSRAPGLAGYAQLNGSSLVREYAMEMAVDPEVAATAPIGDALLEATIDQVTVLGGGALRLWVPKASDADDARASAHGFHIERDLVQMRCTLPLPSTNPEAAPDEVIPTRPFRPGVDEGAWLSANNRAFASHPEQGHWDLATLLEREKEPWFDPEGLLLLEVDGRVVGSCWTKVHRTTEPPLGEIYVIGVDPDFHGRGWGRALTRAGLDWLAGRGLTVGMLYVDAANGPAVSMYRSMGFVEDHVDRAYTRAARPA